MRESPFKYLKRFTVELEEAGRSRFTFGHRTFANPGEIRPFRRIFT